MTNTAKIHCTAKVTVTAKQPAGDGQTRLGFSPDYADGANAEWARYTPSLSLSMVVLDQVAAQFKEGQHLTLLFTEDDVV